MKRFLPFLLALLIADLALAEGTNEQQRAQEVAFTNLQQAVDFIATALESTNFVRIADACLDVQRKPDDAILKKLQKRHQYKDLRHLYADKSFPTNAPTFKLGGHMKELGFTHIDFIQTNGLWKLQMIWICR